MAQLNANLLQNIANPQADFHANVLNEQAIQANQMKLDTAQRDDKTAQANAHIDKVARVLYSADTPEKWAQGISYLESQGVAIDDAERDFNNREGIINQLISVKDHIAAGKPLSELGKIQADVNAGRIGAETGQTAIAAKAAGSGGKAPAGYRWGADGTKLEAIPGGPATKMPAEVAGRLAMMKTAKGSLQGAVDYFLNPENSSVNEIAGYTFNAGDYGRAARVVKVAIEAALRAMTGAAAPESEVKSYLDKFLPSPLDKIETRKQKLGLLESFMTNADAIINQGRGGAAAAEADTADEGTAMDANTEQALQEAREAIEAGVDEEVVRQRLEEAGFDPSGLDE